MKIKQLGKSGLMVSEICLGSMTFGSKQTPIWDARQVMEQFVHEGGNFIDTANAYNGGQAEVAIGQWLADSHLRQHIIIGTKTFLPEDGDPNHRGLSRQAILYSVEQSLQRLQTDYIDLYYTHYWDTRTPLEETLAVMEQLIQQGKVRYMACSNTLAWQVMKALGWQRQQGYSPLVAVQAQYNLLERSSEREIVPLIQSEGLGLLAWSPLAGGFLTGKYHQNAALSEKVRFGQAGRVPEFYRKQVFTERGWRILDSVRELAQKYEVLPSQVALAWVLSKPFITAAITGVSVLDQIDSNLASVRLQMEAEDLKRLDEVATAEEGYLGNLHFWFH